MSLESFLQQASKKTFWDNKRVVCFKGKDYPFLFYSNLFNYLDDKNILPANNKNLIISQVDKAKLLGSLQQSFLGEKTFYWLGVYKATDAAKSKSDLFKFIVNYSGPNFIAFHLNDEKITSKVSSQVKRMDFIEIEENVNKSLFEKLIKFFGLDLGSRKLGLVRKIFQQAKYLSLDQSCMLMQYLDLVNPKMIDDFYDYLSSILVDVQPSLNLLSQYFFSRQKEAFFNVWSFVCNDYSEMFWISFWSEQIWKAYNVVKFLKQKNFASARSMSFRLPFMFINQGWKNFSLNELANRYQFLYNVDFAFKTGSTFCSLDLFFVKHFMNKNFKKWE